MPELPGLAYACFVSSAGLVLTADPLKDLAQAQVSVALVLMRSLGVSRTRGVP